MKKFSILMVIFQFISILVMGIMIYIFTQNNETIEKNIENNIKQVIEIITYDSDYNIISQGTGFFVNDEGYIITNKHLVYSENYSERIVKGRTVFQDNYHDIELVDLSEEHDLALLRIINTDNIGDFNAVVFSDNTIIKYGSEIYTIGNTYGYGLSILTGVVSAPNRIITYQNKSIEAIQISIGIEAGNSGGPIYNRDGKVIGVATFRILDQYGNVINGMNFALPVNTVLDYMRFVLE